MFAFIIRIIHEMDTMFLIINSFIAVKKERNDFSVIM